MAVKPIPDAYHTVTPYLIVADAGRALAFYRQAFGATERLKLEGPGGRIMHAEIGLGDSTVMLADECPEMGARGPRSLGGSPVHLLLYVEDVDAQVRRAVEAGAQVVRPVKDQFYGDRTATVEDPFGHSWTLATHVEDVPPEELRRRFDELLRQPGGV